MSSAWVQEIDERFLPTLRSISGEIAREHPDVVVEVWHGSLGSATDYQGYGIGIECTFKGRNPDENDYVALNICVSRVRTRPQLDTLYVCWAHPSRELEIDLLESPVDLTDDALIRIEEALPKLVAALREAVERGHPIPSGVSR